MEPSLHVRRVPAQSSSCMDSNEGHREVFVSLNNWKVQGQSNVLRPERRGDCKIEALNASMFSDDLISQGTPVLRCVILPICLNVVTHVTIDVRSGTRSLGATLKRFRMAL